MKKLLYIPLLILIFTACKGDAIFYSLENEEKIVDSNNFKDTTPVGKIVIFDDPGPNKFYVTHGKQLWYSIASDTQNEWNIVPKYDGYGSTSVVTSIAVFNSRVYVTLMDEDNNSKSGLYYITSVSGELIPVLEYERRDPNADDDEDDYYFYELTLFSAGNDLFISRVNRKWSSLTSDSSSIVDTELYYYPSGQNPGSTLDATKLVEFSGLSNDAYKIRSITNTGSDPQNEVYIALNVVGEGTDYYTNGKLYKAAVGSYIFTEESPGELSSFNQLYYSDNQNILLLSTRETDRYHSILYKEYDGAWGSWNSLTSDDQDIQFSAFSDISEMPGLDDDVIIVGTRGDVIDDSQTYYNGNGYYEINLSGTTPVLQSNTFALDTNYNSTDLKNASIMSIIYDSENDKVYTSTSSYGLWLNAPIDGERKWFQE